MNDEDPERSAPDARGAVGEGLAGGATFTPAQTAVRDILRGADLEELLDVARIGAWDWSAETDTMRWSRGASVLFGLGPLEFDGSLEQYLSLIHSDDRQGVYDAIASAIATARDYRVDHRIGASEGETKWLTGVGRVFRGASGRANRIVGVLFDSTDRRRSELALRERDEMIRDLVEGSRDWIWAIGTDGRHTYTNPAVEVILGYSPDELLGQAPFALLHADDRGWLEAQLHEWAAAKIGWKNVLLRWRHKDGQYRYLESNAVPVLDDCGELRGFRGVDRDITERIRFEEEKEALEAQLLHAQKMEAVGRLAGGVAHDFNNLLTVILGNLDAALLVIEERNADDVDLIEPLREAAVGAERAGTLTSQLLAFSRRQVSRPELVDLNRQVTDLERMLRRLLTENIELVVSLAPRVPSVRVDPGQFQQIVMNLVVNSRDAMPDGGRLTIRTREQVLDDASSLLGPEDSGRRSVVVSVVDTGLGIAPDAIDHIFEPFFTTKGVGEGTGLGLATVYGIVAQAGGRILVSSEPGRGTSFDVHFPVAEKTNQSVPSPQPTRRVAGGHEPVLVCEDEPVVRRLIVRTLARAGYIVHEAENGPEALRLVSEQHPALTLLVTDVIMPEMNGHKLAESLRQTYPALKVLYCSGYTADVISHHGVPPNDSGFLPKPFKTDTLLQKVREVIDRER